MKYAWIQQHRDSFPVHAMCEAMNVSKSGFYASQRAKPSPRQLRSEMIRHDIKKIYVEKESLAQRGLKHEDLLHLVWEDEDDDWAEKDSITLVNREQLSDVIESADVLLNF